ncbi:MAG TPA: hypothetical protein ENG78_06515 [Acidiferrobacteraceae bacterium]|nr:hypothetical protein [Acidiferrobacteraceae bacterium]HEX20454.1 hypothetical protein [Acidiferrobacteraceae bacterium]
MEPLFAHFPLFTRYCAIIFGQRSNGSSFQRDSAAIKALLPMAVAALIALRLSSLFDVTTSFLLSDDFLYHQCQ